MEVVKRDGRREPVSFDKITSRISKLCYSLDPAHVDPSKVAQKVLQGVFDGVSYSLDPAHVCPSIAQRVVQGVYDGVSTAALDDLAAETAARLTTRHPDYGKLAARIAVSNLHKQTCKSFSEAMLKLHAYVNPKTGEHAPLISTEIRDIVIEHAERLNGAIVLDRDIEYDYFGFKTIEKSYLLRMHGEVAERPQQMLMRVALGIHKRDIDAVIESYNLMSEKWFTHATPTTFNAGTPQPQMSSCFLPSMKEDSIDGIFDTLSLCARISNSAGGIGGSPPRNPYQRLLPSRNGAFAMRLEPFKVRDDPLDELKAVSAAIDTEPSTSMHLNLGRSNLRATFRHNTTGLKHPIFADSQKEFLRLNVGEYMCEDQLRRNAEEQLRQIDKKICDLGWSSESEGELLREKWLLNEILGKLNLRKERIQDILKKLKRHRLELLQRLFDRIVVLKFLVEVRAAAALGGFDGGAGGGLQAALSAVQLGVGFSSNDEGDGPQSALSVLAPLAFALAAVVVLQEKSRRRAKARGAKAKKRAAKAEELLAEAEAVARECPLAAMACSPTVGPLSAVLDEALGVSCIIPASIKYGGTAADMDVLLARRPTRRFLFAGHADVDVFGRTRLTLGFTMPGGGLAPAQPAAVATLLGDHTPRRGAGSVLELAFLNGCKSKKLGMKTLLAGVDYVICWSTLTHSDAALLFCTHFFDAVKRGYSYEDAFNHARARLVAEQRPGGGGPRWEERDPEPIPATLAYPIAAGIPVLLTPADRRYAARTLLAAAMWPRVTLIAAAARAVRRAKQRVLVRAELAKELVDKRHLKQDVVRLIFQFVRLP